jgi:hypothetical protein
MGKKVKSATVLASQPGTDHSVPAGIFESNASTASAEQLEHPCRAAVGSLWELLMQAVLQNAS